MTVSELLSWGCFNRAGQLIKVFLLKYQAKSDNCIHIFHFTGGILWKNHTQGAKFVLAFALLIRVVYPAPAQKKKLPYPATKCKLLIDYQRTRKGLPSELA